jgi:hypothetical protein
MGILYGLLEIGSAPGRSSIITSMSQSGSIPGNYFENTPGYSWTTLISSKETPCTLLSRLAWCTCIAALNSTIVPSSLVSLCKTPCYNFANYLLITFISSLTTHQILGSSNSKQIKRNWNPFSNWNPLPWVYLFYKCNLESLNQIPWIPWNSNLISITFYWILNPRASWNFTSNPKPNLQKIQEGKMFLLLLSTNPYFVWNFSSMGSYVLNHYKFQFVWKFERNKNISLFILASPCQRAHNGPRTRGTSTLSSPARMLPNSRLPPPRPCHSPLSLLPLACAVPGLCFFPFPSPWFKCCWVLPSPSPLVPVAPSRPCLSVPSHSPPSSLPTGAPWSCRCPPGCPRPKAFSTT